MKVNTYTFSIVALLQCLVCLQSVLFACPSGWLKFAGSCYQLNTQTRRNWRDAAAECGHSSSHLVYIDSVEEDRFIVTHLKPLIDESSHHDKQTAIWIGGTDDDNEAMWVWYKSKDPIIEYTNWYPGQPDTGSGHHEEDCICLVGNHGYMWQDYSCNEDMFYVCEISEHDAGVVG